MESITFESIFNVNTLKHALENLNITDVVRRTLELADDDAPGYAWLDSSGKIQLTESAREIDGLVFFEAWEPCSEFRYEENFRIAKWIHEIGFTDFEIRLRVALESEASH